MQVYINAIPKVNRTRSLLSQIASRALDEAIRIEVYETAYEKK